MTARINFTRGGLKNTCLLDAASLCLQTFQDPFNPVPTREQFIRDFEAANHIHIGTKNYPEPGKVWEQAARYGYRVFLPNAEFGWNEAVLSEILAGGVPVLWTRTFDSTWDGTPLTYHAEVLFDYRVIGGLRQFTSWDPASGHETFVAVDAWVDRGRYGTDDPKPGDTLRARQIHRDGVWVPAPWWSGWALAFVPAVDWADWRPPTDNYEVIG